MVCQKFCAALPFGLTFLLRLEHLYISLPGIFAILFKAIEPLFGLQTRSGNAEKYLNVSSNLPLGRQSGVKKQCMIYSCQPCRGWTSHELAFWVSSLSLSPSQIVLWFCKFNIISPVGWRSLSLLLKQTGPRWTSVISPDKSQTKSCFCS